MKAGDLKPGDVFYENGDDSILLLCIKECDYLKESTIWDHGNVPFIYISGNDFEFEIFSRRKDHEVELYPSS